MSCNGRNEGSQGQCRGGRTKYFVFKALMSSLTSEQHTTLCNTSLLRCATSSAHTRPTFGSSLIWRPRFSRTKEVGFLITCYMSHNRPTGTENWTFCRPAGAGVYYVEISGAAAVLLPAARLPLAAVIAACHIRTWPVGSCCVCSVGPASETARKNTKKHRDGACRAGGGMTRPAPAAGVCTRGLGPVAGLWPRPAGWIWGCLVPAAVALHTCACCVCACTTPGTATGGCAWGDPLCLSLYGYEWHALK